MNNLIRRQRLHQRLDEAKKLTVVAAPPGSGKTMLLCDWTEGKNVIWVSLHETDNTVDCFWQSLIGALGEDLLDLVRTSIMPSSPEAVVLTRLSEIQVQPTFLVLDNYEVLTSPDVLRAVAFLLEQLPDHVGLMIASRSAVKLPIARLRAQNQLLELRAADLNFTLEETAYLLQDEMQLPLSQEDVHTLHTVTEGWIAGLQLAAAALHGACCDLQTTIAAFKGDHRYVADYLSEEIFQNQAAEIQTFLLQTSILSHLNASLCDAVTGRSDSQSILEKLEAANLLVIPLDDHRQQYRYHCLFADFLRDRLNRTQPAQELHCRAALWHEQQGNVHDAIFHALLGDAPLAARLIKAHARAKIARGEVYAVKNWLSALPEPLVWEDNDLRLVYAWALAHSGESDRALGYLNGIEDTSPQVVGESAAIHTRIAAYLGDRAKIISCGEYALQHLPEEALSLRADIFLNLGHAYLDNGDLKRARRVFTEAQNLSRAAGNQRAEVFSTYFIGKVQQAQGRLHQALAHYRAALDQIDTTLPVTGILYLGIAEVFYEWNQLDEARDYLDKALKLGEQGGEMKILVYGNILYARILECEAGIERLEQARRFINWCGMQAWQARLWLAKGKTHIAGYWLEDIDAGSDQVSDFEKLTKARVLIAQRKINAAHDLLNDLHQQADAYGQIGNLIEILMLQALAYFAANDHERSIYTLQQALEMAEPEGYVRLFVDEGRPMQQLLNQLPESPYQEKLLAVFGETPASSEFVENLSDRELEVLEHVAAGHSNRTIAEQLFLTEGTVKWYLHNIYGKLNVQSRTQAVARAKTLRLLS